MPPRGSRGFPAPAGAGRLGGYIPPERVMGWGRHILFRREDVNGLCRGQPLPDPPENATFVDQPQQTRHGRVTGVRRKAILGVTNSVLRDFRGA
jgi:hypothetical protein